MTATWCWERRSRNYGNFGNANQWTVNAGLSSLARESTQNSADARTSTPAELVFTKGVGHNVEGLSQQPQVSARCSVGASHSRNRLRFVSRTVSR